MTLRHVLMISLVMLTLSLFACSGGDDDPADGDEPDGDVEDGDSDGDVPDGDEDGDAPDGDVDGDTPDGDVPDGDVDGDVDGDADGDMDGDDDEAAYPDPDFVYERLTGVTALADELYVEEQATVVNSTDTLGNLDVRVIYRSIDGLLVGTADGLYVGQSIAGPFTKFNLNDPIKDDATTEIVAIAPLTNTVLKGALYWVVGTYDIWVVNITDNTATHSSFSDGPITAFYAIGDYLVAGTAAGVYANLGGMPMPWQFVDGTDDWVVNAFAQGEDLSNELHVATDSGLKSLTLSYALNKAFSETIVDFNWTNVDETAVRDITRCNEDWSAAITENYLLLIDRDHLDQDPYVFAPGVDGLPAGGNLSVSCDTLGVLVGHAVGASYQTFNQDHTDFYYGGRWMPYGNGAAEDLRVQAVLLDGFDNSRYLGTPFGLAHIELVQRDLAAKEVVHDAHVQHFWRMGGFFSSEGNVPTADAPISDITHHDHDNDGLWTQMMIAGWCYAYAATGEEKYYTNARQAMDNMFKLVDYPAISFAAEGMSRGFIARSIVSEDETEIYARKIDEADTVDNKDMLRWNKVTVDGKNYLWKADTSSDEIAGHYFGFPIFYDLCAKTDEEREEVARYAGEVMGYIVDNGFALIDLDGTETLHGHWQPEKLAIAVDGISACMADGYELDECMDAYGGGGWLNGLEILGGLLATWHMTGDTKFYDAYDMLITEYRYDEIVMASEHVYTITKPLFANHSDHELAMLAYTSLIRYEPNDERRAKWIESLEFLYDYEQPERNPWWAAVCALSGCETVDMDSAIDTLRYMPDDRREWAFDHVWRQDYESGGVDRFQKPQMDRVLPFDEIRTMWWNGNPYAITEGGNGKSWRAPTAWLLPYYMHLYAGTIIPAN